MSSTDRPTPKRYRYYFELEAENRGYEVAVHALQMEVADLETENRELQARVEQLSMVRELRARVTELEAEVYRIAGIEDTEYDRIRELEAALREALQCGLPPHDVSGERMWNEARTALADSSGEQTCRCIWRPEDGGHATSCGYYYYMPMVGDFCPHCGKRIEITDEA